MAPSPDRPNILIILSDQLRRQALGCYGNRDARTPHIDRLAGEGVRFRNSCSTYPICVPFRFTFMTGEYAHTRLVPGIEWAMSPAERTMADEFNEAGYESVWIGKWHLDGGHGRMGSARQCGLTPVRPTHTGTWHGGYGGRREQKSSSSAIWAGPQDNHHRDCRVDKDDINPF